MLLDTSRLLCLQHRAEPFHHEACRAYQAAQVRLTHGHVLAEYVALAQARRLPRLPVLAFVTDLVANPDIETIWVDKLLHQRAIALLEARPDKLYRGEGLSHPLPLPSFKSGAIIPLTLEAGGAISPPSRANKATAAAAQFVPPDDERVLAAATVREDSDVLIPSVTLPAFQVPCD